MKPLLTFSPALYLCVYLCAVSCAAEVPGSHEAIKEVGKILAAKMSRQAVRIAQRRMAVGAAWVERSQSCQDLAQFSEKEDLAWQRLRKKDQSLSIQQRPFHLETPQAIFKTYLLDEKRKTDAQHYYQNVAFQAAEAIYQLPAVETLTSGRDYIEKLRQFIQDIPEGYRIYYASSVASTGLKYAVLMPRNQPSEPWYFTIAGTETFLDWLADADLGANQMRSLDRFAHTLAQCVFQDSGGRYVSDRKMIVTGHSLGGGLAQILSYKLEKERQRILRATRTLDRRLFPAIELVSWNPFGASEILAHQPSFEPDIAKALSIHNYFMKDEPVSKIGHHFGPTYELPHPLSVEAKLLPVHRKIQLHSVNYTGALIYDSAFSLNQATARQPEYSGPINLLQKALKFMSTVQILYYAAQEPGVIQRLSDALDVLGESNTSDPASFLAVNLLDSAVDEVYYHASRNGHRDEVESLQSKMALLKKYYSRPWAQ